MFDRVETIERVPVEREKVYNLSVEGDETFFAEGLLVHNCRTTFTVTHEQVQEHREVVEPAAAPFDVTELEPVKMRLDGAHDV